MNKNICVFIILVFIILSSSCKNNTNSLNPPFGNELDTFNSKICKLNYPSNWYIDTSRMKSEMSPSIFAANTNSLTSGIVSVELAVLVDSNSFRDGVVNIIQSMKALQDSVDLNYINNQDKEFINVFVQHDSTIYSDNYFYKDKERLYWFLFSGKKVDLFFCKPDIKLITGSLITKN